MCVLFSYSYIILTVSCDGSGPARNKRTYRKFVDKNLMNSEVLQPERYQPPASTRGHSSWWGLFKNVFKTKLYASTYLSILFSSAKTNSSCIRKLQSQNSAELKERWLNIRETETLNVSQNWVSDVCSISKKLKKIYIIQTEMYKKVHRNITEGKCNHPNDFLQVSCSFRGFISCSAMFLHHYDINHLWNMSTERLWVSVWGDGAEIIQPVETEDGSDHRCSLDPTHRTSLTPKLLLS